MSDRPPPGAPRALRPRAARQPTLYNRIAGNSLERLAAISDGIFAVAMTLIALELRVPAAAAAHTEAELWAALLDLAPRIVMWAVSFLTAGIFWLGQQTGLNHLARTDRDLSWLHLIFLACVVLLPFSTTLLAEHVTLRLALGVYWLNILLLGAMLLAAWRYARRAGLLRDTVTAEMATAVEHRILIAQALYAGSAALCVVGTWLSIALILVVQLNYVLAPSLHRARSSP